jgi:hypothetical protein
MVSDLPVLSLKNRNHLQWNGIITHSLDYICPMKHFFYITLTLFAFSLSAQLREFHVTEREPDGTTVVQASNDYPDNAMILVYSDLEGLDFRSSVGGINQQRYNQRANRYEILVNPQRQILFVAARGYIEQRMALINPSPKQVYYYLVEERSGQDETSVIFLVEPRDAQLFVDNIPTEINKTVSVPLGKVKIRLEREGFAMIQDKLMITSDQVNYSYSMDRVVVVPVRIRSNVPQARVEINEDEKGIADRNGSFDYFLFPGIYNVRLSKSGYLAERQTIEVLSNQENNVTFDLTPNTGTLRINTKQSDVRILVNRQEQEQSSVELVVGKYLIEASKEGYHDFQEHVQIERGQVSTVNIELEPIKGDLQFRVIPVDAEVVLKNETGEIVDTWTGIKYLSDLSVGNYTVEAKASGYASQTRTLRIKEGETTKLLIDLQQSELQPVTTSEKKGRSYALLFSYLPRQNISGISLANSNYGLHFTYLPNTWGFYTEVSTSMNFSSHTLVYEDGFVYDRAAVNANGILESGGFLPSSNILSREIGGGVAYRVGAFSFTLGMSYFTQDFRQEFDSGNENPELVRINDRLFRGVIPKAGAQFDSKGLVFGYALAVYPSSKIANVIMLGVSF